MIKIERIVSALAIILCTYIIFSNSLAYGQGPSQPENNPPIISIIGQLYLEKHGQQECLVLHTKDAISYLITGDLTDSLRKIISDIGQNNIISLSGKEIEKYITICEESNWYEYNKKGEKELRTSGQCIDYYNLEATQIILATKSAEEIPLPKRNIAAEERMRADNINHNKNLTASLITGESYGKITSINLMSPIKTIEISGHDQNMLHKIITLIVNNDTRIVKKTGQEEPAIMTINALMVGQEVTAAYTRDESKAEALFIAINKD